MWESNGFNVMDEVGQIGTNFPEGNGDTLVRCVCQTLTNDIVVEASDRQVLYVADRKMKRK